MNYKRIYDDLISSRKLRIPIIGVMYEKHHIVMRSMGGTDDIENIVYLELKEHFIAHRLLWQIHRNRQAARAFMMMCSRNKTWSSRVYEELKSNLTVSDETKQKISKSNKGKKRSDETKKILSEINSGENHPKYGTFNSEETRRKISEANTGSVVSDETKKKLSIINTGKKVSDETKKKMSESHKGDKHPMFGKNHSLETRIKQSNSHTGIKLSDDRKKKIGLASRGNKSHANHIWVTNGFESKFINKDDTIEDGWRRGRHSSGNKNKTTNTNILAT